MDNNIGKLHFICAFHCFSQSLQAYTDTVIIKIWLADCHFELKLPNAFSAFYPAANTCQLKCVYRLLVAWQYGIQELVFGMTEISIYFKYARRSRPIDIILF